MLCSLIKVGVTLLNLVLCTFPHLQMLGQCPANVKETVNIISSCSTSLLLPQGIATSVGAKTSNKTALASYSVNMSALPSTPKGAVACYSRQLCCVSLLDTPLAISKQTTSSIVMCLWTRPQETAKIGLKSNTVCRDARFVSYSPVSKSSQCTQMLQAGAWEEEALGASTLLRS